MIAGMVNANREATIRFMVVGPQGHQQDIEAIAASIYAYLIIAPIVTSISPGAYVYT